MQISAVKAFQDNYIWMPHDHQEALVIDPGEAGPVFAYLKEKNLNLKAILLTHTHADHLGGVASLMAAIPEVRLYASADCHLRYATHALKDGEGFQELGQNFEFWHTPGHLKNHGVFWLKEQQALFCGDTLFSLGCGRIFDGTMEELYQSLQRIKSRLRTAEWKIYPAHEYTLSNLAFAESLFPGREDLLQLRESLQQHYSSETGTLPSFSSRELLFNPFLNSSFEEFKILRLTRNTWK